MKYANLNANQDITWSIRWVSRLVRNVRMGHIAPQDHPTPVYAQHNIFVKIHHQSVFVLLQNTAQKVQHSQSIAQTGHIALQDLSVHSPVQLLIFAPIRHPPCCVHQGIFVLLGPLKEFPVPMDFFALHQEQDSNARKACTAPQDPSKH